MVLTEEVPQGEHTPIVAPLSLVLAMMVTSVAHGTGDDHYSSSRGALNRQWTPQSSISRLRFPTELIVGFAAKGTVVDGGKFTMTSGSQR